MNTPTENGPVDQAEANTDRRLDLGPAEGNADVGSQSIMDLPIFQLLGKTIEEITVMDERHQGIS